MAAPAPRCAAVPARSGGALRCGWLQVCPACAPAAGRSPTAGRRRAVRPRRSPRSGAAPPLRAHFGAYFNGPDLQARDPAYSYCPSNATLYAYASHPLETPTGRIRRNRPLHANMARPGASPRAPSIRRGQTGRGGMEHAAASDAADATQVHTRGRRGRRRHPAMMTPRALKRRGSPHTHLVVMVAPPCNLRALREHDFPGALGLIFPQAVARTFDRNVIFCRIRLATSAAFTKGRRTRCLASPAAICGFRAYLRSWAASEQPGD